MGRNDLVWRFVWVAAGLALLAVINREFQLGLWAGIAAVVFALLALGLHLTRPRQPPD
jgi:formate-dependent nitrite reductase membrane component NrfD